MLQSGWGVVMQQRRCQSRAAYEHHLRDLDRDPQGCALARDLADLLKEELNSSSGLILEIESQPDQVQRDRAEPDFIYRDTRSGMAVAIEVTRAGFLQTRFLDRQLADFGEGIRATLTREQEAISSSSRCDGRC